MPPSPPPDARGTAPWSGDAAVFGHCRLGFEDFAHAVRHEPRTRRLLLGAFVLGVLLSCAGAFAISAHRGVLGWSLLGVGLATFAAYQLPDAIARRWFAKLPARARLVRFTLGPNGLIVASELASELHPWLRLLGYVEAPDSFLVWVSEKLFVILPKRAFEAQDVARARACLERELGAPAELPSFWFWLGAAALLLGVALALWNWLSPR